MRIDFNMLCSIVSGSEDFCPCGQIFKMRFSCSVVFRGGSTGRWAHLEILAIKSILRGSVASIQVLGQFTIFSQRATSSDVESIQSTSVP